MADLTSRLILSLVDRASRPARLVGRAMDRMNTQLQQNNARMQEMQSRAIGAAGAGYALFRGLSAPVTAAANFETAMNQVRAISGATDSQFAELREQAKSLGQTTQFSASQAADAQNFLAMAGLRTKEVVGALPGTLQLAAAAQKDLGSTADVVSNILSGYNMKTEKLAHVNDVLVQTFTSTNTNLSQLGDAMKYAGPVASSAGVDFEETAAALGMMGNAGIQASMAGTSLRGAISRLLNPTGPAAEALQDAGIAASTSSGELKSLTEIVRELEPHAEDTGFFMQVFGQRAGPAMAALVSQGSDKLAELTEELENSGGKAQEIADVQMQGFNGMMRRMRSVLESVAIAVGEALNPALQKLSDVAIPALKGIAEVVGRFPRATAAIVGVTSALIAARVAAIAAQFSFLWMRGAALATALASTRMATGLLGLLNPMKLVRGAMVALRTAFLLTGVGAAIAGVAALGVLVWKNWRKVQAVFEGFEEAFTDAMEPVTELVEPAVDRVKELWDAVFGLSRPTREAARSFEQFGRRLGTSVGGVIRSLVYALRDPVAAVRTLPTQLAAAARGVNFTALGAALQDALRATVNLGARVTRWMGDQLAKLDAAQLGRDLAGALATAVGAAFALVRGLVSGEGDETGGALARAVGRTLLAGGNLMKTYVRKVFDFTVGFWSGVWDQAFAGVASQLYRRAQALFDAFVRGAKAKVFELVTWFRDLPDRIAEAVRENIVSLELRDFIRWQPLGDPARAQTSTTGSGATLREPDSQAGWTKERLGGLPPGVADARAAGGPIVAGRTYLVGEEGAELVTPTRAGYVHDAKTTADMRASPTGRAGGGRAAAAQIGVTFSPGSIVVQGSDDPAATADEVLARAEHALRQRLAGVQADIEYAPGM